jgi:hypothetical protein
VVWEPIVCVVGLNPQQGEAALQKPEKGDCSMQPRTYFLLVAGATLIYAGSAFAASLHVETKQRIDMNRPPNSCQSFTQIITPNTKNLACAITGSGGSFQGGGEGGFVELENNVWVFRGSSCQPGVSFTVTLFPSGVTTIGSDPIFAVITEKASQSNLWQSLGLGLDEAKAPFFR